MEIRIDTKRDTKDEIKHAIEFLQRFINETNTTSTYSENQEFNVPTNMFDTPTPKPTSQDDDFKILEY